MPINRRSFLKAGAALALSTGALGAAELAGIAGIYTNAQRVIDPLIVETDLAKFILLLGVHGHPNDSFKENYSRVPLELFDQQKIDSLFVEGETPIQSDRSVYLWQKDMLFDKAAISKALEKNIPVLTGDLEPDATLGLLLPSLLKHGVAMAGTFALTAIVDQKISRRQFLIGSAVSTATLWAYGGILKDLMSDSYSYFDQNKKESKDFRNIWATMEMAHPEDIALVFRNALIAEKLMWWAENKKEKTGEKPTVAVLMGEKHIYLQKFLDKGREFTLDYLKLYSQELLKHVFLENEEDKYSAVIEHRLVDKKTYKSTILIDTDLGYKIFSVEKEGNSKILGERRL